MVDIEVMRGDITSLDVDAVVNPANSGGVMGGGVAGAIRRRGGVEIEREAVAAAPIPIGEAVVTTGGALPARHVIHAPTMQRPAEPASEDAVYRAVLAALLVADREGFEVIAVPGMGTGVGGLDPLRAAEAAKMAVLDGKFSSLKKIIFVDISDDMVKAFADVFGVEALNR